MNRTKADQISTIHSEWEVCSALLGLDTWQSENQSVYYRQKGVHDDMSSTRKYSYQKFTERLLETQYPQVANGSMSALEAATNVIGTLNTWISAVGMQSAMTGEPCSLSGFDFGL